MSFSWLKNTGTQKHADTEWTQRTRCNKSTLKQKEQYQVSVREFAKRVRVRVRRFDGGLKKVHGGRGGGGAEAAAKESDTLFRRRRRCLCLCLGRRQWRRMGRRERGSEGLRPQCNGRMNRTSDGW